MTEEYPILTVVSEKGTLLSEVYTCYLNVPKTATTEAIEGYRYCPEAVRNESSGATRGVTVSVSAFLACHPCYCAGSSLAWGLNLRAVVCGIF